MLHSKLLFPDTVQERNKVADLTDTDHKPIKSKIQRVILRTVTSHVKPTRDETAY